jgi:glutamine---fructose-6-phosphate transaminase (isomerizing)
MENPLRADILAQGANLHHVLEHLSGSEGECLEAAAACLRNDRPILFIGMGSATYVNMPAEYYLGRHGRFAGVLNASDALYSLLPALRQANVVLSSRSGETVEVVKLAQALRDEAVPFIAVTNEPDSTLAGLAPHRVWFDARKDDLVSINMVTGMMATLLLLAATTLRRTHELQAEMLGLPELMDDTVTRAWKESDTFADLFESVRPIYTLYRGASKGMGQCARLVLEEVARRPAVAMEAAEFRQGAIEVLDADFGAVLSLGGDRFEALNRALAADILAQGGRVLTLGAPWTTAASPRHVHVSLAALPDYLLPLLEIVPAQVLAYKLAERQGFTPGVTRHLPKVITTEVGMPV